MLLRARFLCLMNECPSLDLITVVTWMAVAPTFSTGVLEELFVHFFCSSNLLGCELFAAGKCHFVV